MLYEKIDPARLNYGLLMLNHYWFMRHYWKDDLTITPSIKQRQVFSDTSKKMLLCTARKTFKCLTGDALVLDPTTGQRRRVDQLPEQTSVYAVGREGIVAAPAIVRPNGRVAIYELITENGYRIKVSANHPFLMGGKLDKHVRFGDSHEKRTLYVPVEWHELRDIEAGHLVLMPRRLPSPGSKCLAPEAVKMLAYMIADGNMTTGHSRFSKGNPDIIQDMRACAAYFGAELVPVKGKPCDYEIVTRGRIRGRPSALRAFVREHGLWRKGAREKYVPDVIFELTTEQIKLFVDTIWNCDGHRKNDKTIKEDGYDTASERLARDLQHLLLRLGVTASLRPFVLNDNGNTYYRLRVHALHKSRLFGPDLFWDRVRDIRSLGDADTYDLTVPEYENFIADDTLSHNTGMLEATVIRAALAKTTSRLEEYMFHTPAQAHMNPVRDRIISKLQSVATFNALITSMNRTDGVIEFATNCKWWFRIEGSSNTGKNMIGIRAEIVVGDEGAYSNEAAHRERQLTKTPTCREVWCGVPNGVRGTPFFRADQTIEGKLQGWNTHHLTTYDNPLFQTEQARRQLVEDHGGEHTQAYITQVLGQWGAEAFSSFPPTHIFQETKKPYLSHEAADEQVSVAYHQGTATLEALFALPRVAAHRYVIGADIGFSPDPTVIMLGYEEAGTWYTLARVKLLRVIATQQAAVIDALTTQVGYKVRKIVIDQAGYGKAVADALLTDPRYGDRYKGGHDKDGIVLNANFGGRVEDGTKDERGKAVSKPRKQWATEMLKNGLANEAMRRRMKE